MRHKNSSYITTGSSQSSSNYQGTVSAMATSQDVHSRGVMGMPESKGELWCSGLLMSLSHLISVG